MARYETNLGAVRRFRRMTQAQVSEETGIPLPTLRKWEQGVNSPPADALIKLADLYEADLDTLLKPGHAMPGEGRSGEPNAMLTPAEAHLIAQFRSLNYEGRALVAQMVETAAASGMYRRSSGGGSDVRAAS